MTPILFLWFALLPVLPLVSPALARAEGRAGGRALSEQPARSHLKNYLGRLGRMDDSASSDRVLIDAQLQRFYKAMGYRHAWTNREAVVRLVEVLGESAADGLTPADYHYDEIRKFSENPPESPELKARADLLMTDAVFTLLSHMRSGKVAPRLLDPHWNIPIPGPSGNSDRMLMSAVMDSGFPEMIASLRPSSSGYPFLREGLSRYRQYAGKGGWEKMPPGSPILKVGDVDPRIPLFRKRLVATGDLDAEAPVGQKNTSSADTTSADSTKTIQEPVSGTGLVYTPEMFAAVKAFQQRHGLQVDGVIGNETIGAMNVPVEVRIGQIRINLERQRWYSHGMGVRYVMVNIPAFSVDYVQNNEVRWHSRVIVGKPDLQTPVFRFEMRSLILNPQWVIPSGIFSKETLPAIMKNIRYLSKNQLTIVDNEGDPVDPLTINWEQYKDGGFPYHIVQASGDDGSLGRIKFLMPNRFTVYMHDTPSKRLFERSQRAFSHGCVRVDRPFELAEIVLQDPVKWSQKKLEEAVNTGKTRTVSLPAKVPVYFAYQTAFADGETVQFRADIYIRDRSLREALDSGKDSRIVEEAAR
ncbi:MAG: L,D-transpeptidase family protein [Chlorobiaceae bacterium]|nr:L,D-transpeptidase family protein [Chlorobiaceae bacterium]